MEAGERATPSLAAATPALICVPSGLCLQDVMVAIGGGGFIPARMLRTEVKVPILAVSLELYDDATKTANTCVIVSASLNSAALYALSTLERTHH